MSLKVSSRQQGGRIINIGTNLYQNPVVPYHEYTTAKAGLIGFTRNIAAELGQYGITANVVSGGLLKQQTQVQSRHLKCSI